MLEKSTKRRKETKNGRVFHDQDKFKAFTGIISASDI